MKKYNQLEDLINRFISENGREPQARDFDETSYLPCSRTIQKRYGGLVKLRRDLNLEIKNFNTGKHRSEIVPVFLAQSRLDERTVYETLVAKHGVVNIHNQFIYNFTKMNRADSAVLDHENKHLILYDAFRPKDEHSLSGCINLKLKKYKNINLTLHSSLEDWKVSTIFVCMNPDIILPSHTYEHVELIHLRDL